MLVEIATKTWKAMPRQMRTFIARRVQSKFTVSVTGILTNDEGEVLLLDHWFRPKSGWGPPGGFVDRGEQPEAALRREIMEETSLNVANVQLIRTRTFKRHVEIIFTAKAVGEARVTSSEIRSLKWFKIDEMPGEMSVDLKFVITKALKSDEL